MTDLGKTQRACLRALVRFGSWPGGWNWTNQSTTARILDSLVKRGLVECNERGIYRPTDAGREA